LLALPLGATVAGCEHPLGASAGGHEVDAAGPARLVTEGLPPTSAPTGSRDEPFAVAELFTSEGCSSCPPADEALADIAEQAERSGRRVYTLELHVDYWDDLGWVDPFSSAAHSERQKAYARRLGLSEIYTPELVVNGREELVGSRRGAADAAIERALSMPVAMHLEASVRRGDARGEIRVSYAVRGCPGTCELTVALVQDRAETTVLRGENAHQTLRHRHVVRGLRGRVLAGDGSGSLVAEWRDPATHASAAVTLVSDTRTGAVLAATSLPLDGG
jgi:hypothetical protein